MERINQIIEVIGLGLTNRDSAFRLNISLAQYKRYKASYRKNGAFGLLHKGIGNTNALKYSSEIKQHIITTYKSESKMISEITEGIRKPRKLKVFAAVYSERYKMNLPYTTCKKILNDANVESPICRFDEEHAHNIALPNPSNKPLPGFEFQVDGSCSYRFPDDDFEVVAHVVVEASSSHLCSVNFQKGECNIGYYNAFRYAFNTVGIPKQNCSDGRTTFFNVNNNNEPTTMGKILARLGIEQITTRNCNRNNKVENAHDPIRDYIWDQMLIDGIRTFAEANTKLPHYINLYNKVLKHKISENNVLRKLSTKEIDDAFLIHDTRSMDKKYTIQIKKKRYFLVRNNTILQKKAKTKINVYTTYDQNVFAIYGNNKYELVEATVDNLAKLKKIDGQIVTVLIKRNGYDFNYDGSNYHIIDSLGVPIQLKHRDKVKLSIIEGKLKKVRTNKGIFKVNSGKAEINEDTLVLEKRKITYKQTIEYRGMECVLLDQKGERFFLQSGTEISIISLNNKPISALCDGITYSLEDIKLQPGKYYIPRSNYDARKTFGDMI